MPSSTFEPPPLVAYNAPVFCRLPSETRDRLRHLARLDDRRTQQYLKRLIDAEWERIGEAHANGN